jgi:hypothetical protein
LISRAPSRCVQKIPRGYAGLARLQNVANVGTPSNGQIGQWTGPTTLQGITSVPVANGGTGDTGTAWTTYTPTIGSSSGSGLVATATGRYKTIGKTIFLSVTVTVTSAGSATGQLLVPLPVNAQGSNVQGLIAVETAVSGAAAVASILTSNATRAIVTKYDATSYIATGAVISISGVYESI